MARERQVSQGILPTPERYFDRAAKRSASVVPRPGISPAVSAPKVSRTNRVKVSSSMPVSGLPRSVGPGPSCSKTPETPAPSLRRASACSTFRFMARRTAGFSGWYVGPSACPCRSTRTRPWPSASAESGGGRSGGASLPSKLSSSQAL